jgi:HEAT repeat protein
MSLSSLIVQREVATMRQVEEALARQVIYGGDLVTNLLEVAKVDEGVLVELLAESMRLAPAPSGHLPDATDRAKGLVPREIAVERTVAPLDVRDGKLVLAVAEPLSRDLEEQLRFALGMGIEQRAAPAVRVLQAVSRAYGVPLERRILRLLARLGGGDAELGSTPPPLGVVPAVPEPPRPPSSPPVQSGTPSVRPSVAGRLAPQAAVHRTTSTGFPAVRAPAPASSGASTRLDTPAQAAAPAQASAPPPAVLLQRDSVPGPRPGRRRRGPITVDAGQKEAEEAADRDTLLDLFFDFSQQFFDYSALFLVHGDIAEGRDAFGAGATRERVLGIGVPLDMPSMMSTAREQRLPIVAKAPADGLDAVLLADLHRGREAEMAIVPLVVRTRAVAILIGDCGESGIERASVQQVVAFSAVIGKAFERIIVRRKLSGFTAAAGESPSSRVPSSMVPPKARANPAPRTAPPPSPPAAAPARPAPSAPPVPFVSKLPKRSAPPGIASPMPPPAVNVAVVRKILGPPIPREEPETPGVAHVTLQSSPPRPMSKPSPPKSVPSPAPPKVTSSPSPPKVTSSPAPPKVDPSPPSSRSPQLEVVELEVGEDDADGATLFEELGWAGTSPASVELPASAAVAVPAHKPPAPEAASAKLPSVMIEDLDRELVAMVDRLVSGEVDEFADAELLRQGERAMRAIMSRFPGPIAFSRARIATAPSPPKASDCGPILKLVARERRVALPFVLEQLASSDAETRGWATHLLCELPYVDAIPHLLQRLRDSDASTRVSAAHALIAIARSSPAAVRDALVGLAHEREPESRAAAMAAVGKLREATLVPELVHALGDADDRVVAAAHDALVQVTRQDLGTDARRWLRWWEQNANRHRIEWLIDALVHDVTEIRKGASEELRVLTKEYFGYAGDLPPRDRDRAQQRYRDWWTMEGRGRFRQS